MCIASGIGAGSDVNDIMKPTKQLPDGNGFACDRKSLQLRTVIGRAYENSHYGSFRGNQWSQSAIQRWWGDYHQVQLQFEDSHHHFLAQNDMVMCFNRR